MVDLIKVPTVSLVGAVASDIAGWQASKACACVCSYEDVWTHTQIADN